MFSWDGLRLKNYQFNWTHFNPVIIWLSIFDFHLMRESKSVTHRKMKRSKMNFMRWTVTLQHNFERLQSYTHKLTVLLNSTHCAVTLVYCAVECIKMIFLEIVATVQLLILPQFYHNYSLCADTNIGQSQAIVYYKLSVELWFQRFHAQFEWTGKNGETKINSVFCDVVLILNLTPAVNSHHS